MKYSILVVVISFFTFFNSSAFAQTPSIPVDDETKLITYSGVVEVPKTTADTLYARLNKWFNSYYKNTAQVIKEKNDAKRFIEGSHRFKILKPDGPAKKGQEPTMVDAGLVIYTINVACREERFRYEISKFTFKQTAAIPAERWMDTEAKGYDPIYVTYLEQVDKFANSLIEELEDFMNTKIVAKDKDKW
jgi:hypothetical protein